MKYIKITDDYKADAYAAFIKFIETERTTQDKINFTYSLNKVDTTKIARPQVFFSAKAYLKMLYLVQNNKDEVAWHGTVTRDNNYYFVDDILVYPQTVTAATVSADDEKYPLWNIELEDDVANALRLQGHSHVNMGVTPSGVDRTYYDNILQTLHEDGWYVFIIMNKSHDMFIEIHDFTQNIVFEKADIDVDILLDNKNTAFSWWMNNKPLITATTYHNTYNTLYSAADKDYDDSYFFCSNGAHANTKDTRKHREVHNIRVKGVLGWRDENLEFHPYAEKNTKKGKR